MSVYVELKQPTDDIANAVLSITSQSIVHPVALDVSFCLFCIEKYMHNASESNGSD